MKEHCVRVIKCHFERSKERVFSDGEYYTPLYEKGIKENDNKSPNQEPALELHSRAEPSVEAHHSSVGPDTGRNSGGRRIENKTKILEV